ncbi:unnamed protein product [Protopolystoma xenopodis]|uniref:Uncharacterized protein n=1 Tax=Protopolystoma xenopodis TaxID=117903 RepID=A0A448X2H1_9PLAT|nr:unnamed protein product [Protopolystoma xenopodis]
MTHGLLESCLNEAQSGLKSDGLHDAIDLHTAPPQLATVARFCRLNHLVSALQEICNLLARLHLALSCQPLPGRPNGTDWPPRTDTERNSAAASTSTGACGGRAQTQTVLDEATVEGWGHELLLAVDKHASVIDAVSEPDLSLLACCYPILARVALTTGSSCHFPVHGQACAHGTRFSATHSVAIWCVECATTWPGSGNRAHGPCSTHRSLA